jgi:ribosomal protein S3
MKNTNSIDYINKLLTKIMIFIGFNIKIDSKLIKNSIIKYINTYQKDWNFDKIITNINTFKNNKGLQIHITAHRPGLLIGKEGLILHKIINHLKKDLNESDIEITIYESDTFDFTNLLN